MKTKLQNKGWEGMKTLLNKEMPVSSRKPAFWWWSTASLAALVLLVVGIFYIIDSKNNVDTTPTEIIASVESDITYPEDTGHVQNVQEEESVMDPRITLNAADLTDNRVVVTQQQPNSVLVEESSEIAQNQPNSTETNTDILLPPSDELHATTTDNENSFTLADSDVISKSNPVNESQEDNLSIEVISKNEIENNSSETIETESSITPSSTKVIRPVIAVGLGTNIVEPLNIVGQLSAGIDWKLKGNWSVQALLGGGINQLKYESGVLLKERNFKSEQAYTNDPGEGLQTGNSNTDFEQARLFLSRNYFLHNEISITYTSIKGIRFRAGLETAYRLGIQSDYIRQLAYTSQGNNSMSVFRGNEIEEIYKLYNRWDFRPIIGIGWAFTNRWSLDLSYRHGLNALLLHPMNDTKGAYARNLQLEWRYSF